MASAAPAVNATPEAHSSTKATHLLAGVVVVRAHGPCAPVLLERGTKKPRQCITDERWWTAGRIGGERSSLSGGVQPLPVVEGIVDLMVVVPVKGGGPRGPRAIRAGGGYHQGHKGKEVVQLSSDLPERTVTLEVAGR